MGDGTSRDAVIKPSDNNTHNWVMSVDGSEIYVFDLDGKHLYTKQALTGAVLYTFAYDAQGRLASITDAYSNVTQVQRDTSGNLTGIRAPHGQITQLTLGSDSYLSTIQNPSNETYAMTYYAGGLLHTFQKPRGQVSTFTYDSQGRLLSDSSSAGSALNLIIGNYDQQQGTQSLQVSTAMNRTTSYALNQLNGAMGRIVTDLDGTVSNFQLASNGSTDAYAYNYKLRMNEAFDWEPRFGQTFKYRTVANIYNYDAFVSGSIRNTKTVNGGTSDPFSFTSLNETIHYNDYDWQSVYTPANLTTTITSPLGRVYSYTMDLYGKPVSSKLASYAPVQFTYDANGRLSTIGQSSRVNTIQYDTNGYVSSVTNALNQVVTYSHDNSGRILTTMLPDSRVLTLTYDSNGNLTSLTPASSNQHQMIWNNFDLLSSYTPPVLNSTPTPASYSYNNDRQLTQIQRADGTVVTFNYDATQGSLSSIVLPSGTYSYTSSAGRITSAQSPDSVKNNLSYVANQVSDDQLTNSSGQYVGKISHKNSYNLVSPNSTDFTPTYTKASSAYSNELDTINYAYDHDSNLIQSGDEILLRDANTAFLSGTTLFNVTDSYSYDSTYGELASYSATYNSGVKNKSKRKARILVPLFSQSFTRDALGRVATKTETVGLGASNTYAYTYDSAGRLTDVSLNGTATSHYGYDSNSNRTVATIGGSSVSATYDSQDRLLTYGTKTYGYNQNGERTSMSDSSLPTGAQSSIYTYDALGNLKQVVTPTQTTTYQMDGLNRRGSKSVGGVLQAYYLYEDQYRVGAILDGAGHLAMHFAYGSKANVPDYIIKSTGEKLKIVSDQNGSVRLVVNSSTGVIVQQMDYDEFGKVINDTNPGFQPFGFAGGLYDPETGLTHFGARDYDASVGRWIQKDPILFAGGDTNLYGYTLQDPINLIDPSGFSQQQVDQAASWLRGNMPFLFNGIDPSIRDSSLPGAIGGVGLTPSSSLILVDSGLINSLSSDPKIQMSVIVGTLAHELMHAQIGNPFMNAFTDLQVGSHDMIKRFGDSTSRYYLDQNTCHK
jgi:RHS repeat-associated protein